MELKASEQRRQWVVELLRETGAVTISELQARFDVSPSTARRDLEVLVARGEASRARGGAVLPTGGRTFAQRLKDAPDAQRRLAEAALELVSPGETLFLDGSSTTYRVARLIAERPLSMRVITNSVPVMWALEEADHVEVVSLGGSMRQATGSCVGPDTVRAARGYVIDRVLFSVTGLTDKGVMTDDNALEAELKRTILNQVSNSVLLIHGSNVAVRGSHAVASVSKASVVLGVGVSADMASRLIALGSVVRSA